MAIHDLHDMQQALVCYGRLAGKEVITKLDRKNAGLGICKWSSVEEAFNAAALRVLPFPFVLQPFATDCRDIRVILLGNYYLEAYERKNALNFRNNLHFGGVSQPFRPSTKMEKFCHRVMQRGQFPYAHLDLLLSPNGDFFLNEINLHGGMRGAALEKKKYQEYIAAIHKEKLRDIQDI